jgi:BR serine/threonine kinase
MHFFRQIVYGIEYLHAHAICHRDLKPENILLDEFDNVRIADFGFARWMKSNVAETSCGSPHYAAPEVIRGHPYDGRAADVWSCGVILYALLAGRLPFDDPSVRTVLAKVRSGRYVMPGTFSKIIQDLIAKILVVDSQKRISIAEIKSHPAFRIGVTDGYTLPRPIPIHWDRTPVRAADVDSETMKVLRDVGYHSDEAIVRELQSTELSMAKVFYAMYKREQSIAELPWSTAPPAENWGMESMFQDSLDLMSASQEQPEALGMWAVAVSPKRFSYSEAAPWTTPQQEGNQDVVEVFESVPWAIEPLMSAIQKMLKEQGYEWFHPNETLIIGRSRDRTKYFLLRAKQQPQQQTRLILIAPPGTTPDYMLSAMLSNLVQTAKMSQA